METSWGSIQAIRLKRFAANAHHIGCKPRLEPAGMLRFAFDLMNQIKSKTL
jgi:hypothetical protein